MSTYAFINYDVTYDLRLTVKINGVTLLEFDTLSNFSDHSHRYQYIILSRMGRRAKILSMVTLVSVVVTVKKLAISLN